jgi:hypothetical protein
LERQGSFELLSTCKPFVPRGIELPHQFDYIANMSEKKVEEHGASKDVDYGVGNVHSTSRRKSSAVDPAVLAGEIFDERYETTQRGLKSR